MNDRHMCMEVIHMRCVDFKNRVAAAVMAVGVMVSFTACKDKDSQNDSARKTRVETEDTMKIVPPTTSASDPTKSVDELKSINGPMLTIYCEDEGPYDYYEDDSRDCSFTVYYNGDLERTCYHSMSDPVKSVVTLSDNEYYYFYQFCVDYVDCKALADYSEDVCDGTMYSFAYYDETRERHSIYSGYCYNVPALMEVVDRAGDHFYPDFSIPCQNRIGAYEGLLDTVTNLSCPEIQRLDKLPEDVVLEAGIDLQYCQYFYEYTYTTTEDAEKGPIVCYVSNYGYLVAMKNNRNWDVADLLIEVNGVTLTAQWDAAMYNTNSMMMILYQQGSVTVEMQDCEFGKEGYVKDLQGSMVKPIECKPGAIIICMDEMYVDHLYIVTKEGEYKGSPLATINSVTQEELEEILGEGPVTVTIREAAEQ